MRRSWARAIGLFIPQIVSAQLILAPARVFDAANGTTHEGWVVVIQGDRIVSVGPRANAPSARQIVSAQLILAPARVFDAANGTTHEGWVVVIQGDRIVSVGPRANAPSAR